MSKIEVNAIEPQCGTTLTLGANNDKIALGTGASFGGGVAAINWETTAQAGDFGALSGRGYFVNTTSAPRTVTLPATPSAGDIVAVADYAGTAATNNITIARNSSNINGAASDLTISKDNSAITLVYVDGTQGWKGTDTSNLNDIELQPAYIVATGGTITCCGDYKIHTFTGPGTFSVSCAGNPLGSDTVDYLVVAGGGGSGSNAGGGAGAGGYRESSGAASGCYTVSPLGACVAALPVSIQGYPITVGGGGAGMCGPGCTPSVAANGTNSVFSTIISAGGGGSPEGGNSSTNGSPGGSGGGSGGYNTSSPTRTAGSGNTPPVSPPQGNNGGTGVGGGSLSCSAGAGGGGGATTVGNNSSAINAPGGTAGPGGAGATSSINGTPTARAGGGGGGSYYGGSGYPACSGGTGGTGGGGNGGANSAPGQPDRATAGTTNTGGGAGGGGAYSEPGTNGGSGIVIIRYNFR
jgi:hypothetical protein